jgi:hypothetical protein
MSARYGSTEARSVLLDVVLPFGDLVLARIASSTGHESRGEDKLTSHKERHGE